MLPQTCYVEYHRGGIGSEEAAGVTTPRMTEPEARKLYTELVPELLHAGAWAKLYRDGEVIESVSVTPAGSLLLGFRVEGGSCPVCAGTGRDGLGNCGGCAGLGTLPRIPAEPNFGTVPAFTIPRLNFEHLAHLGARLRAQGRAPAPLPTDPPEMDPDVLAALRWMNSLGLHVARELIPAELLPQEAPL